jgi:proton-dependent oligopeptide transporter, POT family
MARTAHAAGFKVVAELLGHPRGLYICFATELWERFSYYGMRALLIYYLTQHFLFSDEKSYAIYGAYTALAWGLPVLGGILADRYIGPRRAVTIGALLLSAGHILLAFEGRLPLFFLSLALIASGVGFLKSNITTLVGALYAREDRRRDAGFTIFYMGINIGGAAAPLLCGWLGQTYGWSYGFGLAGLGMLLGLAVFLYGQRYLPPDAFASAAPSVAPTRRPSWFGWCAAAVMVIAVWQMLTHHGVVGVALSTFSAVLGASILYFSFARCTPIERDRMLVVVTLIGFAILFWSFYEQIGSSLNLFSHRVVDRHVFGVELPASQLQSLPSIFVILLAPFFSIVWSALGKRSWEPNTAVKFSLGLLFVGLALLLPVTGATMTEPGEKMALGWFAMTFALMVCGELCIAPVAMNMVSRLCPARVVGMMMGSYFLSLSIGSFVAGRLAALTRIDLTGEQPMSTANMLQVYSSAFTWFGGISMLAALALFVLAPVLRRGMHETG